MFPTQNGRALPLLLSCFLLLLTYVTGRIRGQDGTFSLLIAVPLSKNNQTVLDPGWFHMAAALLAVDHFNTRNDSIVRELGELQECGIQFGNVVAVDTGTNSHQAMEYVVEQLQEMGPVDSIAGPYNEIPALELSVMATGMKAPIVAHRAFDSNLLDPQRHPYYSQVSADFYSEMQFISNYLRYIERDNYIAILYSSTPGEVQKVDILQTVLEVDGFDQVRIFGYKADGNERKADRSVRNALEGIIETGYRTIILLPSQLEMDTPIIGKHAMDLEMDQGGHFWLMSGGVAELTSMEIHDYIRRSFDLNATFLKGSAYAYTVDDTQHLDFSDTVLQHQRRPFFDRVQRLNPVSIDFGENASSDAFPIQKIVQSSNSWMRGTSFMFDAVISIGMGACKALAQRGTNETTMTGEMHLKGIRSVRFHGASGDINFGQPGKPGSRGANTVPFAIANLIPHGNNGSLFVNTESWDPRSSDWIQNTPFVYADGTTNPPKLRDDPDMNYLSPSFRAAGLALMSVALVFVFSCALWVFVHRHHSVVIAAQPSLLYALCLGSTMMALAILMYSYDESYGWTQEMLDRMCTANIWIDSLGHMIAFSALFTKLWRVNRCMRYNTSQVNFWRVMWPSVLLIGTVIILLSILTAGDGHGWERSTLDETTGDSIGRCVIGDASFLIAVIYILHFIPAIMAGVMAWKTSGVDDLYSESKWVLAFILVQIQVLVVAAPVVALLNDVSTDARFFCYTLLIWTFPMSTMGLILVPKIVMVQRMKRNSNKGGPPSNNQLESGDTVEGARESAEAESNNVRDSTRSLEGSQEKPRSGRGPRIQVVTFD
ncbi:Gamma-aminobutyric acid (GABA) B receptor [Seminavis robusta]|uniref:Gamma-aminobutyric acid (GABA) B receptor n=1 Tax=Seminavis robusta TaxID=568900 RepID=A0A9N8HVM8_9STRA|nr:Gamma-aminobutyric acid (GABA) B receptor [Seminavis robusta]|eukprot:Sro1527_g279850.1 Gamma-aminobutyric acid (GABA) B receptor (827) ;mRNA; f:1876-4845